MFKIMVHFNSKYESINQFAIGYMINPPLNYNNVFREQVEKCLSDTFHERTMETVKYFPRKNNTCVMSLTFFIKLMNLY